MKLHLSAGLVLLLLVALCCVKAEANNRLCEQWSNRTATFDLVAVTDDTNYGEGREEDLVLVRAFRMLGRKATRVSIQDYDFDWKSTKMVIIRSAWNKYDYLELYNKFQRTMDKYAILMNPLKIIQWQANKDVYMKQLRDAGINTPRTIAVTSADDLDEDDWTRDISHIQEKLGCEDILVKPARGNDGIGVNRLIDGEEEFMEAMEEIVDGDVALFQCFQKQLMTKGERGIVFVGGEVSHGILKQPEEGDFMTGESYGGTWSIYDPTPEEAAFAKNVASKVHEIVGEMPAYLRVDVFNDNDDNLALMELAAGTAQLRMVERPEAGVLLARYLDEYLREREEECNAESSTKTIRLDEAMTTESIRATHSSS